MPLRNKVFSLALFCLSGSVFAEAYDQWEELDEILITTRKTTENPQQAPVSVTVIQSKTIEAQGLSDIEQLAEVAPNFSLDFSAPISGSSNASSIYMRGVGQSDFLLVNDPGVGVYQDGIYISRSVGGVLSLANVERVEVVRGPQGTLFGRNSIGGAINIIRQKPAQETFGEISFGSSNLGGHKAQLFYSQPLIDNELLSTVSLTTSQRDGYVDRVIAGDTLGGQNRKSANLSLRWVGLEDVDINLNLDYQQAKDEGAATIVSWAGDPTLFGRGAFTDLYNTHVAPTNNVPGFGAGIPYDSRFVTNDPDKSFATGPSYSDYKIWGVSFIVDYQSDGFQLKSLTGYRQTASEFGRDPDGSPITIVHTDNDFQHYQFSQELQLNTSLSERLEWLSGIYYFYESGTDKFNAPTVKGVYEAIGYPVHLYGETEVENQNVALYSSLTYQLSQAWELSLGGRYNYEKKKLEANFQFIDAGLNLVADPHDEKSFKSITEQLSLAYHANNHLTLYAAYATGFKSGGFTGRYVSPTAKPKSFEPEELSTYEIGFKSDWLGQQLWLNGAMFYSDYEDIQVLIFNGVVPETRNAARGKITGGELEVLAFPGENWEVSLAAGYLDARYTELDESTGSLSVPLKMRNQFVNTPEWSSNLSLTYHLGLEGYDVELYGNYTYRSQVANDAINTPELIQPALGLYNSRITVRPASREWLITFFGKNLTNKRYVVSGVADKATFGVAAAIYAPPREWGAEFKFWF